ncbi:hypothetical protein RRG08_038703 [Elysia crispata]|uniref:Uncharacterized protein n=1 Tax=Elysia crispata TaxID=231223 RepID=A0AAE1DGY5_9GAST|nr:hypothetical protein RRG08_038703 [Elysia crispata]
MCMNCACQCVFQSQSPSPSICSKISFVVLSLSISISCSSKLSALNAASICHWRAESRQAGHMGTLGGRWGWTMGSKQSPECSCVPWVSGSV